MSKESVIGKKYYPVDNSYAICLTDGKKNYLLGGNHYSVPKQKEECIIVSQPFEMLVKTVSGDHKTVSMILVECSRGFTHAVLFHQRGFENRVMEPIQDDYWDDF